MIEKKLYEKPSMKVHVLKHRTQLLQASVSSDVNATMDGTFDEETI